MAETLSQLKTRLDEADKARHDLMLGRAVVEFEDSNGEKVRYSQASSAKLNAYIADLERKIALMEGKTPTVAPMRVYL